MKSLGFLTYSSRHGRKLFQLRQLVRSGFVAAIAISVGALVGVVVENTKVFAQSDLKKVSLEARKTSNDQIKFSNLKVGESAKGFEQTFPENKGWIGKVSYQVENISNQKIVYLSLKVLFPETKAVGAMMAYSFSFGNRPGTKVKPVKPLEFEKGDKMTIDLADEYRRITNFVSERYSIDDITQIDLEASFIVFEDGTAWTVGTFMRQDPHDPTRWVP